MGEERVVGGNTPAAGIRTEGPDLEMPTGVTSYLLSWSFWSSVKNLKSPETHWREGEEPANTSGIIGHTVCRISHQHDVQSEKKCESRRLSCSPGFRESPNCSRSLTSQNSRVILTKEVRNSTY